MVGWALVAHALRLPKQPETAWNKCPPYGKPVLCASSRAQAVNRFAVWVFEGDTGSGCLKRCVPALLGEGNGCGGSNNQVVQQHDVQQGECAVQAAGEVEVGLRGFQAA